MKKEYSDEKFLIGDDFNVPMEMIENKDKTFSPVIWQKDGSKYEITVKEYIDKVLGGGKAQRVTDEEFEQAKKRFEGKTKEEISEQMRKVRYSKKQLEKIEEMGENALEGFKRIK